MPIYEYHCEEHGVFEAMRPIAEYNSPCACPVCGAQAERIMLSVPNIANMGGERRLAHSINEKASDSPKKLSTHGPQSSRGGNIKKGSTKTLHRPDGSKSFPAARPWMLSH